MGKVRFSFGAIFRVLRTFLMAAAVLLVLFEIFDQCFIPGRLLRMLPMLAIYAASYSYARRTGNLLLTLIGGVAAVGLCALLGGDTSGTILMGAAGVFGYCCAVGERTRTVNQSFRSSLGFSLAGIGVTILMMMAFGLSGYHECSVRMFACAALQIPVAVGVWMFERADSEIKLFSQRSTQPSSAVKKRVLTISAVTVLLTLAVSLLIPRNDGMLLGIYVVQIVSVAVRLITYPFYLFSALMTSCLGILPNVEDFETYENQMETLEEFSVKETEDGGDDRFGTNLLLVFNGIILTALAVLALILIIRAIIRLHYMMKERKLRVKPVVGFDTIERFTPDGGTPGIIVSQRPGANAERIRRAYRKCIITLKSRGMRLEGKETPDELVKAAAAINVDIAELTGLYCAARYSQGATAAQYIRARKLVKAATQEHHK